MFTSKFNNGQYFHGKNSLKRFLPFSTKTVSMPDDFFCEILLLNHPVPAIDPY